MNSKKLRPKTLQLMALCKEFKELKEYFFPNHDVMFYAVCDEEKEKNKRYNQLLGLFFPQFRSANWINPLEQVQP